MATLPIHSSWIGIARSPTVLKDRAPRDGPRQVNGKINRSGIMVTFRKEVCHPCIARERCTHAKNTGRRLHLSPQVQYEALQEARAWYDSNVGKRQDASRAGVEGTRSQGIRGFGLRPDFDMS